MIQLERGVHRHTNLEISVKCTYVTELQSNQYFFLGEMYFVFVILIEGNRNLKKIMQEIFTNETDYVFHER